MSASQQDINPEAFGLSRFHEVEAGRPVLDSEEEEGLAKEFPQVSFVLGDRMDQGQGTLFITSRRIIWLASQDHKHGYAAAFQNINMHAIYSSAQRPCIYMQMEPSTSPFTDEEPEDAEDDEEKTPEVMLVPADASTLDDMFKVLCECAALNPDPGQEEDDEEGDFFYDEEEVLAGAGGQARAAMLDHYDSLLDMPRADQLDELVAEDPERFEDPEEEEEEEEEGDAHNGMPHPTRPEQ